MLTQEIQTELQRLNIHPVNLDVIAEQGEVVKLRGSLLSFWKVPTSVDGQWFLEMLRACADQVGPEATMNAYQAAYAAQEGRPKAEPVS